MKKLFLLVLLSLVAGEVFAGLTINPITGKFDINSVGNESYCLEDGTNCPSGLAPNMNDVGSPDGNSSLNFSTFTNTWTSTSSGVFWTITGGGDLNFDNGSVVTIGGNSLCQSTGTGCPAGIGATAYDDILDPDANTSINFTTFTNTWTSSFDGTTLFTLFNTDADNASTTSLLDLKMTDDGDVDSYFIRMYDNNNDLKASLSPTGLTLSGTNGHWLMPENSSSPTTSADTGALFVNASNNLSYRHESDGNVVDLVKWEKTIILEDIAATDAFLFYKAPYNITITDIDCIVDPAGTGESVVIDIQECNSTGDSCSTVDTTITCDNDGATDDGSFSNPSIDINDWMMLDAGTVTGTIEWTTILIQGYK